MSEVHVGGEHTKTVGREAVAVAAMLVLLAVSGASSAEEPLVNTPPPLSVICPAIEQDYAICSGDLLSGNCPRFVSAAEALGRLYLFNVQREPSRAEQLQSSIWWGCGSQHLSELYAPNTTEETRAHPHQRQFPPPSLAGWPPSPWPSEPATSGGQGFTMKNLHLPGGYALRRVGFDSRRPPISFWIQDSTHGPTPRDRGGCL